MSTKNNKNEERELFQIEVTEHLPFNDVARSKYVTSNDFLAAVAELFKNVFSDFEGCTFDVGNGEATVGLIFNHGEYDEDAVVACMRPGSDDCSSSVIARTRTRDHMLQEGDRYQLTQDAKDAITPLLVQKFYNNGKPNWKQIAGDFVERNGNNIYMPMKMAQTYTKISGIDLNRLCSLLYGNKIENDFMEYQVNIVSALNPQAYQMFGASINSNYMLLITRASSNEVKAVYEKLGYGTMNSNIIRA